MVIFFNPRVGNPQSRRFPLSVMQVAAMLPDHDYVIVDGNVDPEPVESISRIVRSEQDVELLAVTVMPGPQMEQAVLDCRSLKSRFPDLTVMWGGYFPSMYADAVLKSSFVDFVVRGQGEQPLVEFLTARRTGRSCYEIPGLAYRKGNEITSNPPGPLISPDELPERLPYSKIQPERYIGPSFLGARTAAHHVSMGCPFSCNFCGVISVYGSREKIASPDRIERQLSYLRSSFGVDSIQFFDNNFFLGEKHALELAERLVPLGLKWWCEARIDVMLRFSDPTWSRLRDAGCRMIFFGAESGSNQSLRDMRKELCREQIVEIAGRSRRYGITPEFSFMFGSPRDPMGDALATIDLVYELKEVNPDCEIIFYHYTPTPQRHGTYGDADRQSPYPDTLEEWMRPEWQKFARHYDPEVPWLGTGLLSWLRNCETVIQCRWPTIQDFRLTRLTRRGLQLLSSWRYRTRFYHFPVELKMARRLLHLRNPRIQSL